MEGGSGRLTIPFGSVHQDLHAPIRLQNGYDVTYFKFLAVNTTQFIELSIDIKEELIVFTVRNISVIPSSKTSEN